MTQLKCPRCGWVQVLNEGLTSVWEHQKMMVELFPDEWRSKCHPFTCVCGNELEEA